MKRNLDGLVQTDCVKCLLGCTVRWLRHTFLAVSLFAVLLIPVASYAQEIPLMDIEEEDDLMAEANAIRGALPRMNRQQMEEYMYGSLGGSKAAFQKLKRESIRRELDRVHSICELTEEQWSKLDMEVHEHPILEGEIGVNV